MDYGKNIKYFNSTDTLFYVGLPICILGAGIVACYFLMFYFLPYQVFIGSGIALVGGILAFVPRAMRSNEKDLDEAVSAMTAGYIEEVTEKFGLQKQLLPSVRPALLGAYLYGDEGLLGRRGKDDRKVRTSRYSAAAVFCTKHGIVISHKTFSLIDETTSEQVHEFLYTELADVSVVDLEHTHTDGGKIKDARFVITAKDGTVLELPTVHIIAVDRLCEDICRMKQA